MHLRQLRAQAPAWGSASGIRARTRSAPENAPPRPRVAETQHQHSLSLNIHLCRYLNFSVDSPNSTSIMVIIQNLTTNWFSFQPFNS